MDKIILFIPIVGGVSLVDDQSPVDTEEEDDRRRKRDSRKGTVESLCHGDGVMVGPVLIPVVPRTLLSWRRFWF